MLAAGCDGTVGPGPGEGQSPDDSHTPQMPSVVLATVSGASAINIGFNGGPDQFRYTDEFHAASVPIDGPRLCHTYVHWNVASSRAGMGNAQSPAGTRAWLEYWLSQAAGHCDEALISFKADDTQHMPSVRDFGKAFARFLGVNWAQQTGFQGSFSFTPWNEPNNPGHAGNGLGRQIPPERAARYYLTMVAACGGHGCKVAAGDFASNGNMWNDFEWNCANDNVAVNALCEQKSSKNPGYLGASYLDRYKNHIVNHAHEYGLGDNFRPRYFAFHGWHDINEYLHQGSHCGDYSNCATRRILKSLGASWGQVELWDTEAGVDQDAAPISDHDQACGAAFLLRITAINPRITRLYITRAHGGTGALFTGQTPRDAFHVLANRQTLYAADCR
jgi:hypothetical protein